MKDTVRLQLVREAMKHLDMSDPINELIETEWHGFDDWRNYVPDEIRGMWDELSLESLLVVCVVAAKAKEKAESAE